MANVVPCNIENEKSISQNELIEQFLKQLIKTTVEELTNNGRRYKELHEYPPVLRAHHIQELLQVSEGKAYEILRSLNCPTKRFGKLMTVPRDQFWEYYLAYESEGAEQTKSTRMST